MLCKRSIAQKQCKAGNRIELSEVTMRLSDDFHKLINICVENFTAQKYFFRISARSLLNDTYTCFDLRKITVLE